MEKGKLIWTEDEGYTGTGGYISTNGRYRLWRNETTGNWFIYRVTRTGNPAEWDALLNARYTLEDAKAYAEEHFAQDSN
jgi:hypothetical protein